MRVLFSFPEPRSTTNPYTTQLLHSVQPYADCEPFSWRSGLLKQYDVFHAHWPEVLVRGQSRGRRARRTALFGLLLARLYLQPRVALVRTIHNIQPHEGLDRMQRFLLGAFERRTDYWIVLNDQTPTPDPASTAIIPHGHYIDWYRGYPVAEPLGGHLLIFGFLRPYKGVEDLLSAFRSIDRDDLRLTIQGRPKTEAYGAALIAEAGTDPRVAVRTEFASEPELARLISEASLIVLPYRGMLNSGALLLALSLGRPVLVPASAANDDLAAEVGQMWVQRFSPPLTAEQILRALENAEGSLGDAQHGAPSPDLRRREWDVIGREHLQVYRESLRRKRMQARSIGTVPAEPKHQDRVG